MHNKEKTQEAEEILARISEELDRKGLKQAELITFLDLPLGTYSQWKAGRSRNICEHLGEISEFLETSAEYLVTGKIAENSVINSRENQLLLSFRKLNTAKQQAILNMTDLLAEPEPKTRNRK